MHTFGKIWMKYGGAALAIILVGMLVIWMFRDGLNVLAPQANLQDKAGINDDDNSNDANILVQIEDIAAIKHQPLLQVTGFSAPSKETTIKAGITARINNIYVDELEILPKSAQIISFDDRAEQASLAADKAHLVLVEKQYKAAKRLSNKGFEGDINLTRLAASVAQAKAAIINREEIIKELIVKTPFEGIITELYVEDDDYITVGQNIANYISLDPLWVTVWLPIDDAKRVKKGDKARVSHNSMNLDAVVKDINVVSDNQTRSIKVRLSLSNANYDISSNIPLRVSLYKNAYIVYPVPNSALTLDDDGQLGVKIINANNIASFAPVSIVSDNDTTSYITLHDRPAILDTSLRFITYGHAYVTDGDTIE